MPCYFKVSDFIFVLVDADRSIQQNQSPMVYAIYICNYLMLSHSAAALYTDIGSIFAIMMQ
jgi:hypothetical protein